MNNDGIEQKANGLEAVDDMQSVSPGTTLNGKYAQVSFGKFCYAGLISDDGDDDDDNECEIHCMRYNARHKIYYWDCKCMNFDHLVECSKCSDSLWIDRDQVIKALASPVIASYGTGYVFADIISVLNHTYK